MSNTLKSEVKIATAHDIGVRMDDLLEAAKNEVAQASGAQAALNESAKAVAKLLAVVDTDITGGLLDLEQAKFAKLYVNRAVAVLENLARHTSNMLMTANGKVAAFEKSVQSVSVYQEAEKTKMRQVLEAPAAAATDEGAVPVVEHVTRPGMTLKERRLAEERNQAAPEPPVVVVVPEKKTPKRGRPKRRA